MATYTTLTEEEQKKQSTEQQTTKAPELNSNTQQLSSAATEAPAVQQVTQQKASTVYNPANDTAYQQAMNTLQQVKDSRPTYQNSYESQLQELYNQITGREAFNYDMTADTLYQQYKQQYQNQGQLAMRDTMGQAAALTGGYGSSYGQAVGQQQYNAYLQQLNDVVPELYGMAYQQYQDKGTALQQQYSMMGQMADDEYAKYQDSMAQYWQDVSYQQGVADDLYNRGMQEAELNYSREQDAYSKLSDLVLNFGYAATAEDLEEAGMSQAEYDSLMAYYKKMNPDPVASGGVSYSPGKKEDPVQEVENTTSTEPDSRHYGHLQNMVDNEVYSDNTKLNLVNSYVQTGKITPQQGYSILEKAGYMT